MATESNMSFHQDETLGSALHRHAISFQPEVVNSSVSEMITTGGYYGMNNSTGNLMFCENANFVGASSSARTAACGNPAGSLLLDSVPGLDHDTGLAAEWNEEEQYKLEDALVKYKDEPNIMRYIKIAATFRDKTVRDVALRCRWMTRKRRKQEELHLGRKGHYRKDKFGDSSSKANQPSVSIPSTTVYSFPMYQVDQNQRQKFEVLTGKAKHLLSQNIQALNLINNNLSSLKLQDNLNLFCCTGDNINNITAILNDMREFSGKISQMQELSISIDQNLAHEVLPRTTSMATYIPSTRTLL